MHFNQVNDPYLGVTQTNNNEYLFEYMWLDFSRPIKFPIQFYCSANNSCTT